MRFVDRTLLRFADAGELGDLISPPVGQALLDAAFVFDHVDVGEVDAVTARTIALVPALAPEVPVTVAARQSGGSTEWHVSGTWRPPSRTMVHAVLEVSVTAATRGVVTSVTAVQTETLAAALPMIEAAADLDAALDVLVARMPGATRNGLAETLRRRGVTDVDHLRRYLASPNEPMRVLVTLVSDATTAPAATTFRLTVAAHVVEDLATGLGDGVAVVAAARESLGLLVDPLARPQGGSIRHPYPGLLVFPVAALDDADLPFVAGQHPTTDAQQRTSRLSELTTRLHSTGIVPVAT